jgi:integrase
MDRLDESAVKSILSAGRHMGRDRYQEGRVVLVGKHIKKWRGHFYVYQKQTDGSEVRRHRNIPLGLKSEMDRGEAKAKLREIIARETKDVAPAPVNVTLRWFYENRFLPQKEQQWKVTSRPKTKRFIENYLLKRFGDTLLGDRDKFTLQTYLNEMAPRYSKSVLSKIRVYFNSMLDEAVELEMLPKNPAGKLAVPKSGKRKATKHLTPEEIPQILFHLSDRDRLIVRMFLVLGLRPGEMFALRWNDKQGNSLRIDSSITDGTEVETKTEGSDSFVWLPASIETELEFWRGTATAAAPDAFIFPSSRGTAINTNNFLFRVLKEAGRNAGIEDVTHQMLRRTCSTYMAQITSVKDVQAHLRHTNAKTTLDHYIKSVPESVRVAVESLDQLLKKKPSGSETPAN